MSEFVASELVWVKLGGVHWPAVIKDKGDCEEFLDALKRDPIAVVEFFDKKLHDVHTSSHICRYNCQEKEDIIMKSLQLTRNKPDISENFKKDVITAEKITDGDVHILSKSTFIIPTRKKHDDLFGKVKRASKSNAKKKITKSEEASPKKVSKYSDIFPENTPKSRKSASKPKKPSKLAPESPRQNITHPRFIAENDHQIRILSSDPPLAGSATLGYRCTQCAFATARLNVLVMHNKMHIAAASAKTTAVKRKHVDSKADAPHAKKPKKKHVESGAAAGKSKSMSGKPGKATAAGNRSRPSTSAETTAGSALKKGLGGKSSCVDSAVDSPASESSRLPVKLSPLKSSSSFQPLLIDDWDEDDDEEVAERMKIQSEIDRFITDRRSGDSVTFPTPEDSQSSAGVAHEATPADEDVLAAEECSVTPQPTKETPANDMAHRLTDESLADDIASRTTEGTNANGITPGQTVLSPPLPARQDPTPTKSLASDASTETAALRQRNDALLQAAVDDVLADTAPLRLPTLPNGADTPRPRPLRLCPPNDDVTSSPCDVTSSTPLPTNLQILSVPGGAGQPDTYALVSVDEKGNVQTVNPVESLRGLGADTLLAYEVVQEDGSTRTAYLNPSSLSTSSDIKHLLTGDARADSSTLAPDSGDK